MFVSFGGAVIHTAVSDVTKCLRSANNNGQIKVSTNFAAMKVSLPLSNFISIRRFNHVKEHIKVLRLKSYLSKTRGANTFSCWSNTNRTYNLQTFVCKSFPNTQMFENFVTHKNIGMKKAVKVF